MLGLHASVRRLVVPLDSSSRACATTYTNRGVCTTKVCVEPALSELLVAGVPVGRELPLEHGRRREKGSVIVVVATDAPRLLHQLKRLARRSEW